VPGARTKDPSHWLYRLDPDEWLAAAETELLHAEEALARRAVRPGITHARRGAGMALNALLVVREEPRWGRSYMEHVQALAGDERAPAAVRAAAALLRDTPPQPPELVTIGKPDLRAVEAARAILAWARAGVSAPVS
jgi:hypothetical protein